MFSLRLTLMLCAACGGVSEHHVGRSTHAARPEAIRSESSTRFYQRDHPPSFLGVVWAFAESDDFVLARVMFAPPQCCTEDDMACATRDPHGAYWLRREIIDGWVWGIGNPYRVLIARCAQGACDIHRYIGIHAVDSNSPVAAELAARFQGRLNGDTVSYPPYVCSEAEHDALNDPTGAAEMQREMQAMQERAQQQQMEDSVAEHE